MSHLGINKFAHLHVLTLRVDYYIKMSEYIAGHNKR